MILAYNHSNPLRALPGDADIKENHLRKVEASEEAKEETVVASAKSTDNPMNMPKQPQGYIKAPLYEFF